MFNLELVQKHMHENRIDAWLIYDFRGSNPVMWDIVGEQLSTTRRMFFLIPQNGQPKILLQRLDREAFHNRPFELITYVGWEEMHSKLRQELEGYTRVAMEYSPGSATPTMAWVDGGMLELIRSFGIEIVSSANVYQMAVAAWSETALESHTRAVSEVVEIKQQAFDLIRHRIREGAPLTEYDVQEFIMQEFRKRGLETEDVPVVAVNENSANPHYEPSATLFSPIKDGDWVLIDLWARYPGAHNVFADITWVGYIGEQIPPKYVDVFELVRKARDQVVSRLDEAWHDNDLVQGWELDMVARSIISDAGFGIHFIHRTGHSMGPGSTLHALGVNLDNLETHDTRTVLPAIGFSVEPGIYLEGDFGIRLEINVFMDPKRGPVVTTPLQDAPIHLI